jgi:hypothetical protein
VASIAKIENINKSSQALHAGKQKNIYHFHFICILETKIVIAIRISIVFCLRGKTLDSNLIAKVIVVGHWLMENKKP